MLQTGDDRHTPKTLRRFSRDRKRSKRYLAMRCRDRSTSMRRNTGVASLIRQSSEIACQAQQQTRKGSQAVISKVVVKLRSRIAGGDRK